MRSATTDGSRVKVYLKGFQSTHSLRSATREFSSSWQKSPSFNPRTPCGVRLSRTCGPTQSNWFQSTHSLRSATEHEIHEHVSIQFQSTHSLRSATNHPAGGQAPQQCFNPRTPCGVRPQILLSPHEYHSFNPRTPCGVRRAARQGRYPWQRFQSTHSLRSATMLHMLLILNPSVSIHALLAECDLL